ncbi:APLP-like protein [Mya arenaria]|uniref:APLP-like protein n=1 Tax=Mya arenaria TaxID=6604 RepID=A0ABY7FVE8_MYAAR|nr:APLP-like protein [Mya arenaria]
MGHTLFFILALVAGSQAGPIQEIQISDKCARQCTVSNQFNYEPGTTYEFTYETDIRTAVQGASEDHAGVHLTSKVYLDFASKCEMIMRLSDVKLSEHDPETSTMKPVSSPELADLEKQPLTVSFQDGTIEDLCLSQSDVAGTCETEYSSQDKGWYKQIIKKSKNLLGCTERHNGNSAVQGIPYQAKSGIQSIPIVKSTQECEQEIAKDTGRLNVATCREKHAFVPFSRQDSGAITHSTQTLTYVKEYASRPRAATVQSRTSLKFEHSNGNGLSAMGDIENKLTTICDVTSNGVTPETPKMFTSLVLSMKSMSAMDMNVVYKKIKTLKLCSSNNKRVIKFFMDAVPMTGTTESVKFMTQLITSGDVSGIEAEMWMTSLAFLQQPSVAMLNEVKDLLKVENLQEKAMLSVSSLVHSVCRNNPACENYIEVKKIISLLESKIAPSCSISGDYKMSLLALRAIGNAGFGTNAISTLEKCFRRTENPIEIRLSAIEAFRRIPCSTDKPILFEILGNTEEDSEVRIAAYKSIMECASDETISKVKIVLSKESVNQVGSYIWSHLTNLMETSDPHKQSIRSILEDDTLKQEFNMDKRKFSRNYEGSLFLEKINTGATVEGDLIWSSKSFIPRSGMFNLTVDLFGNAINLFEIGGRVEGLEYFLESYFGPNGYFSEKEVKSAVDETAVDLIKADKVSRIDKRMESVMDDLRGSLYMRVFGNELRYMNFKGLDSLLSQNSFNFLEVLMKLSNENDYQFTHSTMFIDSTIVIPTSSGFPLNLTVNGSATIDMKASGMVDVMKMASSPRSLDIHGIIRPSAAVVVSSVMGIDVLSNQVGVKMISTLHSSSAIQGKMSIVDGSILTAEFDLPDEKMDIISVKSEFYTMHRESERLQKMITSNRQSHSACSGPNLVKVAGLEICAEMSFPNASLVETAPYFPITGPMNAGITLYKRDIKMTGYKLEARSTHEDGTFDASIASPWKKGDFRAEISNKDKGMRFDATLTTGPKSTYTLSSSLQKTVYKKKIVYKPQISIRTPSTEVFAFGGTYTNVFGNSIDLNFVLDKVVAKPVSLSAKWRLKSYRRGRSLNYVNFAFESTPMYIKTKGKFDNRNMKTLAADIDLTYIIKGIARDNNFRLVSKVTHSHNSKALNSTATLRLNKNAMESNLQLQDESTTLKNLNGIWRIDIPGKKILMTHALKQSSENSYDLSSKVKVGRSENTFDASWKTPSAKAFTVSSNVQLDSMTPLKLEGDFNLDPAQYKIGGEIMRGSSKYSAQLSSEKLTATSVRCLADIVYPTRHIIGNFESSMANGRISSRSDLRWNADRDDSQRITVSGSGQYQDMSNMDGSLTVQYSSRTVSVNVKQTYTNKYLSHMDLKWGVSNSVSIDTVFGSIAARDGRDLIGSVKLSTPIQQLKSVELSLNHKIATTNYNTQVDLKFDTDDSISAELKVQRPINIRNIDAVLIAKAPSYGLKSSQANLQHSVTDGVSTVAKFNFNKQFLNADIHLTNNGNENDINLKGQLNFKSSMQNMEKGSILLEHSNNGRDVNTNALLQYNNKEYGLKSTITATMNGMNIATDGSITITLPSNGVSLTWNHRNTKSNMQSTSELILNGNQYSLDIKSIHDMSLASGKVHSTLQINTPYRVMKETVLQIIHEHRSGHFDSVVNISNEGMTIVTVEGKYERSNNQVKSKFTTSNSLLGDDVSVILNADYSASPSKAHLELSISPSKIYSIDGTYRKETSGDMDISISANTPNNPAVILYGSRFVKKTGIESKLQLQYMSGKNIQLDSFHNPNEISLKFSSPFTSDFATNAMYKRTGNTLTTSAKIDAEPLLGAWLVSASFDINERLSGNVKLTTPIASVPYSQITFVSYMVDNKRQSSLSVEYLPGKTVRLDSKYSFQSVNDLAMSLEFSSPFDQMPYARVSINHVGDLRRFSNNGEIEYQRGKVMSIETRYSGVETKSGSLIIRSPFYEDISASFNYEGSLLDFKADVDMSCTSNVHVELKHKGNFKNFESSSHILVDNTKYGGSLNFKSSPGVEASLAIETPIRNARFSASHKGPLLSFSNQMELSVSDIGVFSSDFNVDLLSTINLSAIVKTPIRGFSDLRGSLTHEGYISKFQTQIELQRNQDIYFASTKVNTEPAFIAETLLKTPYKALREARISILQEGVINNFKFHGEMQLNKDITELDLNVDATKKIDVDFTLRSPYTDTIKATFDHWGKLSRFQSKLRASAGSKRLIANAKFQMQPTVNALFTVKSPISWLKSHQLSLKHSGTADSFKCNLQYKCNGDTYIGDATFQNLNSLKGELTVKGPSFSTIKASVNHEGKIQNFKSSASVSMGKDAVEANINMNTVNGLKGGIAVATPFYGYKNIQTAVVHSGDLHNFKSHGEFSLNKKSGTIDISFDSTNGINGKVTMINSFNSLKDLTLTVTHNGDMNNFNTIVQCSSNKKSLLGEASFKNGISKSGSVSLKSTLPGIDNYAASFSHEGDMSKFTSSVNTNCPGGATAINLVFDSSNGIQARLTGETPMTKKAEIVISHVQSDTSSNSDVSVRYDGVKQFGLQSDLTIQPTVSAIVSVITPLEGYESSELQLHHNGNANGLRSNAAVNVFGKRFETEIELTTSPDIQGSFKISSPLAEELVGKFIYEGSMKNFKSNIDMTYGGRSGISVDMSFNIEDQFSGDLRIISPHINNLETSFTHKGDLTAFVTDARVIYAGQKSTLSMDVKTSPTVVATFTLTTPMSKDMKLSLSHTGPCSNSHTSANVQYGTESLLSIDSRINHERSINVGITITSVLPQLKIVSVKVTHDGIYTDFASHAEVTYNKQNLVGDLSFKPTSGSFILKTPFFKDITASFDRDNANTMNGNSNVNVAYGVTTLFAIKLDANLPYTWIVQVQVPVNGYETSELTYRKEGEVGGHFTIDIAGQLHGVEAYISKSDKLGAVTPFTEPIEFECEIDGTPRQFTLDSSAKYGKEMHKLTGSVNTIDTYECQINIRSPRVIPIAVGFKHDGELTNFKSHGEVKLDNDKHSLDAWLSIMNDAEGFLSIESPMVEPIQVDGSVRNFKTQAKFTIGSTVMLDSEVAFQSNPINLDLTIKNPIRDIQATLSKSGPWTNFQSSAQLIVASETILDSDLSANVNPLQGSFNFKTPVKTLSGSIFVDGTYDHFDVKGELAVDGQSSFMNIQFKSDGGILGSASFAKGTQEIFSSKLSFETSPLRASLSLKSTNEYIKTLSASFSHKGKVLDFENQAEITINGEKTEAHMLFNIGSKSEMKISASSPYFPSIGLGLEFVGNAQKFQSAMEYSVGENTFSFDSSVDTTNGIDTFMTVKTPFEGYKTVTSKLSYNGIFPNSDGLIQIKTGRRTLLTGNFQLSNVKGISLKIVCQSVLTPALQISFDHSGDMQKFTTRAELRFNGTPFTTDISFQSTPYPQGSFAVVTPYMEPVTGSFNVEPQLNGNSINIKATFNGQPNSLDTSFYFGNDMGASFSMNSHVTGTIRGSVSLNRGYSSYTGSVNMEALGKKMTLDGKLNTERGIKSSISMTSPYGNSEAEFAYSGQYPNAKADLTVSMPGYKFSFNSEIQTQPKLSATLAISTPFSGYENVGGNIHFASNNDSVSFDTQINYLTGKQIAASFESTISGKNVQTVAKLETPYTEDLNIELTLTGQPSQFSKSLVVSMGEDNNLISTGTFSIGISSLNLDYSLKTTFAGYVDDQHIQVKYDADLPNFKASADAKILGSLYSTEASLDLSNEINALFKLDTPFEHLSDIAVTFEHSGTYRRFTTKSTVQAKNKSLFESNLQYSNYGWRRLSMSLDMTTPFQGCEFTKASYRHASLSDGFECDADISIMNKDISGTLTINNNPPTATVSFTTPFAGFEKLGADVKYVIGKDSINGQVNVAYMQDKTLSASIDMNSNSLTFKLSTPFQGYENHEVQLSYNGEMRNFQSTAAFTSSAAPSIRAQANLRLLSLLNLDGSVSLTSQIRNFENIKITVTNEENKDVSGNIGRVYQGSVSFTNDIFEKNTGLTLTGTIDPIAKSVVAKYNCPTMQLDLNGSLKKSILVINTNRYGYEISESFAKIILPTRSLKVTGKVQNGATEGFLFWDADKDETKKVGFRSEIKSQSDSMKADMTVMLPSLGKDLQIDSEMILNRGRIIFDGKTELTYSKDSRKKITINSRVEDISSWDSRNYSFTFGISHPYTSVNVEVVSHVGNSNEKMTGAVDVKYLTARRETKQFTVNGELDKIRKGVELNIDTPMKKVGINGNIQAGSPYRLSLVNKYDNKKPLNTIVSFDSVKRSIDFQMNYDLENPTSELHVSAKYVNNSAIAAELYHVINRQRISDGLLALRLNSSHLLHSRIHWRPDMIADLKEYTAKKSSTYKRQVSSFADAVSESISAELRQKSSIINRSFMEESEPFVATATEQLERLAIMYELNQYHMRDIVDVVLAAAEKTKLKLHDMSLATSECMNNLSDELSKSMGVSKETIKNIILEVEKSSGMIMQSAENVYNIYSGHVYNITAPVMTSVNDKYNTYVNYMSQMSNDHMTNMADKYTSAIYGVNDAINTRVSRLLANKQVGGAYQHGYNAYKYWEIRENAEIIAQAIIDWIKEEIEIELSDIKATLLNLKKSTITVYDPKHGEIQAEIHLPLPIKTLDAVPVIEMDMSKTQKYIPKMPSISLPSSDVSKWLPPYEAIATIEGDTITTFDGLTYDLTKSCTFLLAKDNVNGNFTVVLNKENNNKTLVIIADGKAIELLADGQIKVDRQLTALPAVFRDTTMTSLNGHVKINVAGHLDVDYVKELDSYTIVMNGFYFGKTNGLLGSYDNEPYNDMMTSFGKPSDNADRFVKTWEVGTGKCR